MKSHEARKMFMDTNLFLSSRTTIASYPGGKSDKKKHSPLFRSVPNKLSYLVEPFAGLANFFLVISPRVERVWLNDKNPEVFALLNCMQESELLQQLIEYIKSVEPVERDNYYQWKKLSPSSLLERAVRLLIILNCSPNGAGGGYSKEKAHRKWYTNKPEKWNGIHKIFQQKRARITNLDYLEVLELIGSQKDLGECFLYLDPPYFKVAQRGKLYGDNYNLIDWKELREVLSGISCRWILSNRDAPEMRDLFSDFHLYHYNTYNDMNNTLNKNPELLISNMPFEIKNKKLKVIDKWL